VACTGGFVTQIDCDQKGSLSIFVVSDMFLLEHPYKFGWEKF